MRLPNQDDSTPSQLETAVSTGTGAVPHGTPLEVDRPQSEGEQVADSAKTTVFVAEDEAIIRLDICETLTSLGYVIVGSTAEGNGAEEAIRALRPDVAVLDIKMPGLSGLEVARRLSSDPICAIVILTAFSQEDLMDKAADVGVLAYLLKPFKRAELTAAIRVAQARFAQLTDLQSSIENLEQRLTDRRLLERAKGLLIDSNQMSESEAMAFIQRHAMDSRRPMRDVASAVLEGLLPPTPSDETRRTG